LLSLPYGGCNERVLNSAIEAGYERIFLNVPVLNSAGRSGYLKGRLSVSPEDWRLEFKLKALGAYQWLPFAIKIKQKLKHLWRARVGLRDNTQ
jgi:hypothetical protein